jgi:hypothetical protein
LSLAAFPYLTVATVGDDLPPESLARLYDDLESTGCDVAVSAPRLLAANGSPSPSKWPIHRVIEALALTAPWEVPPAVWLALTLGFFPKSPLASSSGNLYRTHVFANDPFPVNCGHRGDVIWAIKTALKYRWVIDPGVESTFKFAPPSSAKKSVAPSVIGEWRGLICDALSQGHDAMFREGVPGWFLNRLAGDLEDACQAVLIETRYRSVRQTPVPWFLDPRAIRLRRLRKMIKRKSIARKSAIERFLKDLAGQSITPSNCIAGHRL